MIRRGALAAGTLLLIAAACTPPDPAPLQDTIPTTTVATLSPMQATWEQLGIDSYEIDYTIENSNGMGGGPKDGAYAFTIEDGLVASCSFTPANDIASFDCVSLFGFPHSPVDYWHQRIGSDDDGFLTVKYHARHAVPMVMSYDEPGVADEEYVIRVTQFRVNDR